MCREAGAQAEQPDAEWENLGQITSWDPMGDILLIVQNQVAYASIYSGMAYVVNYMWLLS